MAATPPLVDPERLWGFPGAPFEDGVVAAAAGSVRSAARWHIAPTVTETLTVDSPGGQVLLLPSMHVLEVTAVRDVTGEEPRELTGWRWSEAGILSGCTFPAGLRAVEVDLRHGYDTCPDELLPVVAAAARAVGRDGTVASQASGPFSVTYREAPTDPVLARYTLPPRP